jgi:hypothetical protein
MAIEGVEMERAYGVEEIDYYSHNEAEDHED